MTINISMEEVPYFVNALCLDHKLEMVEPLREVVRLTLANVGALNDVPIFMLERVFMFQQESLIRDLYLFLLNSLIGTGRKFVIQVDEHKLMDPEQLKEEYLLMRRTAGIQPLFLEEELE